MVSSAVLIFHIPIFMTGFVCDKVNDGKIQLQSARAKKNDI